jgi:hypothetical protein
MEVLYQLSYPGAPGHFTEGAVVGERGAGASGRIVAVESQTNGKPTSKAEAFAGLARLMMLSGLALVAVGVVLFLLVGPFLGAIAFVGLFDLGFAAYMRRLSVRAAEDERAELLGGGDGGEEAAGAADPFDVEP